MPEEITLKPIGVIHTAFKERYDAPSQPERDRVGQEPASSVIVLNPNNNFEQAVQDLKGFEKIWILSWFHQNRNWKPMVRPPRSVPGTPQKRGLFATRSPHRPNGIGLTLTDLLEIKGRKIYVGPVDLLDDTPILDIKPYLPEFEAFPEAATGWVEELKTQEAINPFHIQWSALAREQLTFLKDRHELHFEAFAERILRHDPAPHPYRRVSKIAADLFQLAIKSWRLEFKREGHAVIIERIKSGYAPERLAAIKKDAPLHNQDAHLDFHSHWPLTSENIND